MKNVLNQSNLAGLAIDGLHTEIYQIMLLNDKANKQVQTKFSLGNHTKL